jgi:hypothetical protein
MTSNTSTLSPEDTGEIEVFEPGQSTENLAPYQAFLPPPLRRPDATGEMPRLLDDAPAQPIFPLERVLTGDDLADTAPDAYVGRHRAPDDMPTRLHRGPSLHARFVAWLRPAAKR